MYAFYSFHVLAALSGIFDAQKDCGRGWVGSLFHNITRFMKKVHPEQESHAGIRFTEFS